MPDPPANSTDKGLKWDGNKPRTDLLPAFPLLETAKVLSIGAKKYGDHNWRNGMKWSRPYAATLRHLFAWIDGEDLDPESGLNHIDHAICELLFLRQYVRDFPANDDRWTSQPAEQTPRKERNWINHIFTCFNRLLQACAFKFKPCQR